MKTKQFTVSPEVREVLKLSTVTAQTVTLPPGRMDRVLYMAVDKVLKAAGGKWLKKQQCHVFTNDPREALGLAVTTGKAVNQQQTFQAFYTPLELAHRLVQMVGVKGRSVLEPSAGRGALANACVDAGAASVKCVELNHDNVEALRGVGHNVQEGDFMQMVPRPHFDCVVMNPPFTGDQDILHVRHALDFVRHNGSLAAIVSPRFRTVTNKACSEFEFLVRQRYAQVIDVPAGTFKEAGTNIATLIVLFNCARYEAIY